MFPFRQHIWGKDSEQEIGMRADEALRLTWADMDFVNGTVRVTPEKGSEPRIFKISGRLLEMLG